MNQDLEQCVEILARLVSFESVSGRSNEDIVGYIQTYLSELGVESTLSYGDTGNQANLFATIGPEISGGLVLNGHTDVVPVDGQDWSTPPFTLTQKENKLYGRGSVDMKGFLACVLASVPTFQKAKLKKPIHIAFSYDEEIGGLGMPHLLSSIHQTTLVPSVVIVGEPTQMQLITGHKGGFEMRAEITGFEVHSCNPTQGVNAIFAASKLINKIDEIAHRMSASPHPDSEFDPPYCTFNVGTIEGGMARNATAGWCNFDWEFRPMPGEDGNLIIQEITDYADQELLPSMRAISPKANINIITEAPVPALDHSNSAAAAEFVSQITGLNSRGVVSFGTDAGYFSDAGMSTVVFGPGSIDRAHKPDEYVLLEELSAGLEFLQQAARKMAAIS